MPECAVRLRLGREAMVGRSLDATRPCKPPRTERIKRSWDWIYCHFRHLHHGSEPFLTCSGFSSKCRGSGEDFAASCAGRWLHKGLEYSLLGASCDTRGAGMASLALWHGYSGVDSGLAGFRIASSVSRVESRHIWMGIARKATWVKRPLMGTAFWNAWQAAWALLLPRSSRKSDELMHEDRVSAPEQLQHHDPFSGIELCLKHLKAIVLVSRSTQSSTWHTSSFLPAAAGVGQAGASRDAHPKPFGTPRMDRKA